ncbi:asparaginase domain-containing protein [uncultured Azohydromonas sp.]|jgi:L-asparaginase/archaeal Glu-tRNAGln amidotransferase subunit D|uniref:asparaginase domain-containing protein n=1 Tax=uncultured Azohydromonas sp. TaxID=487342 RepID=UPI0026259DFC|nr:asparaginase domain-containing protein [uncultured Azohydromonas sp.]
MIINVINTGGTISCIGDPLAPMSAQEFAEACQTILDPIIAQRFPELQLVYVTDLVFPESPTGTLDSTNLQPTDWCRMAQYILQHYAECDGWIVLHGTDTMGFTGTALPFLLSSFSARGVGTAVLSKPVILTGSQVPLFYEATGSNAPLTLNYNTDAFQNFCGAAAAAQTGIPEVCIYFNAQLFRGNRGVKTDANHFDAFSSPNFPALGVNGMTLELNTALVLPPPVSPAVSLDEPAVRERVLELVDHAKARINGFPVMPFNAFPAWYDSGTPGTALIASLLQACTAQGIKGLVLASYGAGNFPSGNPSQPSQGAVYQALASANAQGVIIVDCTQVPRGVVNDSAYAAGSWLAEVGALGPLDMTPMAALAKLMVLLTLADHPDNAWSPAQVKRLFQLNLLGEMLDVSRLDSRVNPVLLPGQTLVALDGSATLVNDPVLGPRLRNGTGTVLWSASETLPPQQMPGRLMVNDDGSLVFQGRNGTTLWSAPCGGPDGHASMLMLDGSANDGSLSLSVLDYVTGGNCVLYSQGGTLSA